MCRSQNVDKMVFVIFIFGNMSFKGSGCGSVGRAVALDTRGPGFKSSHRQKLNILLTVNCV